ncbi:hypothetical protein [Cumulibacter soli]|uniref:hypothetical protein n=1 Tax=Cumulibacter soli TaxID=2546344 RepID=UPI00106834CD|nr:hypothetical protein [Cumulibacter soli]
MTDPNNPNGPHQEGTHPQQPPTGGFPPPSTGATPGSPGRVPPVGSPQTGPQASGAAAGYPPQATPPYGYPPQGTPPYGQPPLGYPSQGQPPQGLNQPGYPLAPGGYGQPPSKNKTPWIVGGAVVALLAIVGVVLIVVLGGDDDGKKSAGGGGSEQSDGGGQSSLTCDEGDYGIKIDPETGESIECDGAASDGEGSAGEGSAGEGSDGEEGGGSSSAECAPGEYGAKIDPETGDIIECSGGGEGDDAEAAADVIDGTWNVDAAITSIDGDLESSSGSVGTGGSIWEGPHEWMIMTTPCTTDVQCSAVLTDFSDTSSDGPYSLEYDGTSWTTTMSYPVTCESGASDNLELEITIPGSQNSESELEGQATINNSSACGGEKLSIEASLTLVEA